MQLSRRETLGVLAASAMYGAEKPAEHFATGVKTGEVTTDTAVIWTRRTKQSFRNEQGVVRRAHLPKATALDPNTDVNSLEGSAQGGDGYVRCTVEPVSGRAKKIVSEWKPVDPRQDYAHSFRVEGLQPATTYRFSIETKQAVGKRVDGSISGSFATMPKENEAASVSFALSSCQIYCRTDRKDGFWIYDSIEKLKPAFLVSCGDNVYYDSDDPIADREAVALYHWQRMYSLPTLTSCLRSVPAYFQKDDHDTMSDDCWPGMKAPRQPGLTFEMGQRIFRYQVPSPPDKQPMYRKFRWGTDLEVWLPEGRDYRSPNTDPDSELKTIWGSVQKQWLKDTLSKSTARWKIVVNPNPIIGPDHQRKKDNHSNPAFATEGREMRMWLRDHVSGSVILMNGDRHWQYHSVDPETGINEFGCGPASDEHAVPPGDGENPRYHKFLRIKGGFIFAKVNPANPDHPLVIEHRDVQGNAVYSRTFQKKA
jgi:alkaline phosphatase D